jgi:hypothetical protein
MIFVDAHVHIYECFDIGLLLDSALNNFMDVEKTLNIADQESLYVLLLTEGENENWFQQQLAILRETNNKKKDISPDWCLAEAGTDDAAIFCENKSSGRGLYLVPGRQIVTEEKIEVLALCTNNSIENAMSLPDTVTAIGQSGAIPVLPWGVGKWLGTRGDILQDYLSQEENNKFYLGDNGGRPWFWHKPALFELAGKKDVAILPGSDPLPIAAEASRVGSFGFYVSKDLSDSDFSIELLKDTLFSPATEVLAFGKLMQTSVFVARQLQLRFAS